MTEPNSQIDIKESTERTCKVEGCSCPFFHGREEDLKFSCAFVGICTECNHECIGYQPALWYSN